MERLNRNPFGPFFDDTGFAVLDGGLATALETDGFVLNDALWSASVLRDDPEAITRVHRRYREAGADCLTTASYQASFEGFAAAGIPREEAEALLRRSTALARRVDDSSGGRRTLVAASIGPWAAYRADGSEYTGRYETGLEELDAFHRPRWDVLVDTDPDLLACETIPNGSELEVLLRLLDDSPGVWAWFSFCCGDGGHLWDGTPIEVAASACARRDRVAAIGVNCTAPRFVPELVRRIRSVTEAPAIVYPNSGERYDAATRAWHGTDQDWLDAIDGAIREGATVIGGCCRIGPAEIGELRRRVDDGHWSA